MNVDEKEVPSYEKCWAEASLLPEEVPGCLEWIACPLWPMIYIYIYRYRYRYRYRFIYLFPFSI